MKYTASNYQNNYYVITTVTLVVAATASTFSTKAAGLLWLVLICLLVGLGLRDKNSDIAGIDAYFATTATQIFLIFSILSLILRTFGVLYWRDSWSERHAEIRILIVAIATWWCLRKANPGIFLKSWSNFLDRLTHAFGLSCLLGLIQVWVVGRENLTTHPIPWAAGVSLLSIWLLHSALWRSQIFWQKCIWILGGLCGVFAVLTSQSRGSFGVVFWWIIVFSYYLFRQKINNISFSLRKNFTLSVVLLIIIFSFVASDLWKRPILAINTAVEEYHLSQINLVDASETSFGARLYIWQRALQEVQSSPIWGFGQETRRMKIRQWGRDVDSDLIQSLSHVHNQYLNDMIDYGLFGLTSTLTYLIGWSFLALWLIRNKQLFAGFTFAGVAFIHATTSLSNVNFGHNYYTSLISILLGINLTTLFIKSKLKFI